MLHESGQSTAMTLVAVQRLNRGFGQQTTLVPEWSSLALHGSGSAAPLRVKATSPVGVNMRRVATVMRAVDAAEDGPVQPSAVAAAVAEARRMGPSSDAMFALAAAAGAAALSVIFGATAVGIIGLAAATAGVGAVVRRALGRVGGGPLLQLLVAALIAGLAGGLASKTGLGAAAALAALCPAMVLVPGPQTLIATMDLLALRLSLGIARLGYATLALMTIGVGLALGAGLVGERLSLPPAQGPVPFVVDVVAAGIAAACYPVFFSMPYRLIGWSVAAGMAAHALRWWLMTDLHVDLPVAAGVCCLLVGALLVPISYRYRIPFAGIGFAAVVSMVPGVYAFEVVGGLIQIAGAATPEVLAHTATNAIIVGLVVVSMSVGLTVPAQIRDTLLARTARM
jgi:uncharacterized membrane protein YjjB (DUF3815 family)